MNSSISLNRNQNNFDFIRLFAAVLVLIHHSSYLFYGTSFAFDPFTETIGMSMGSVGVKIFFVISGFLIAKSWENKKSILDYMIARILRIYPAAIVVVLISVFVLGLSATSLSSSDFLAHESTLKYLQNTSLYRMYYYLPGVFDNNPIASINGSLWTLPYEFTCYILLGFLGVFTLLKSKRRILASFTALLILNICFKTEIKQIVIPIIGIDFKTFFPLLLFFISGSLYYHFRDKIRFDLRIAIVVLLLIFLLKGIPAIAFYSNVLLLPYIVLSIAFSKRIKLNHIGKYGDFSYGIYLYAFPIQQSLVYLFNDKLNLISYTLLSLILSLIAAAFSWHLIESPSLQLKKYLSKKLA